MSVFKAIPINGIKYQVPKEVYDLIVQLTYENNYMLELLEDAYFLNREVDNIEVISQNEPLCN